MKEQFIELAGRIRELREACGFSLEELAAQLDIQPETLAEYEKCGEDIPISVIYEIANRCGVEFNELLTGNAGKLDTYHVVKRGHGREVDRYPGYRFEDLAFRYGRKIMQPLLVTIDPSDDPVALVTHQGQEFNLVLEGSVILMFEDREILLEPGDSVYFNATHRHGQRCAGTKKARFLTVIAE